MAVETQSASAVCERFVRELSRRGMLLPALGVAGSAARADDGARLELLGLELEAEWTDGIRLRHCRFIAMRDDKAAREVIRET